MQLFSRVLTDLQHGENIDLYITVAAAVGIAVASLVPPAYAFMQSVVAPMTLGVLALLAGTSLRNRHRIDDFVDEMRTLTEANAVAQAGVIGLVDDLDFDILRKGITKARERVVIVDN